MKIQDLVKLNLDDLETELVKGSFSKSFLDSLLEAEKAGKDRSGAVELIQDALELVDDEPIKTEVEETKASDKTPKAKTIGYVVAQGQSIGFRAGIKTGGDVVYTNWPEFEANDKLLSSMLERGLVVVKQ